MSTSVVYLHHRIACAPRRFTEVAGQLPSVETPGANAAGFGVWRSQIGRPRDELNAMSVCPEGTDPARMNEAIGALDAVREVTTETLRATLRPERPDPPTRQGNYAFRWFELPRDHWPEFCALCEAAWPGFESAYDSQVIGLWRCEPLDSGPARALLLTRRPDLAMWERSKIPANAEEQAVRDRLSRRYDLCDATQVYTTTLLSARDHLDEVRWT